MTYEEMERQREEEQKKMEEWLKSLKVGDTVCYRVYSWSGSFWRTAKVKKITPTGMLRLEDDTLVNSNGRLKGSYAEISPLTAEVAEDIRRQTLTSEVKNLLYKVDKLNPNKLSTEELEIVKAALDKVLATVQK